VRYLAIKEVLSYRLTYAFLVVSAALPVALAIVFGLFPYKVSASEGSIIEGWVNISMITVDGASSGGAPSGGPGAVAYVFGYFIYPVAAVMAMMSTIPPIVIVARAVEEGYFFTEVFAYGGRVRAFMIRYSLAMSLATYSALVASAPAAAVSWVLGWPGGLANSWLVSAASLVTAAALWGSLATLYSLVFRGSFAAFLASLASLGAVLGLSAEVSFFKVFVTPASTIGVDSVSRVFYYSVALLLTIIAAFMKVVGIEWKS